MNSGVHFVLLATNEYWRCKMCTIQNVNEKLNTFGNMMESGGPTTHVTNPGKFLVESGLLFKINREILHPLGLAITITLDNEDKTISINILDKRTDPEGILFTDAALDVGIEKLQNYMNKHGNAAIDSRRLNLGFKIQTKTKH
jgi:hypothetical protein